MLIKIINLTNLVISFCFIQNIVSLYIKWPKQLHQGILTGFYLIMFFLIEPTGSNLHIIFLLWICFKLGIWPFIQSIVLYIAVLGFILDKNILVASMFNFNFNFTALFQMLILWFFLSFCHYYTKQVLHYPIDSLTKLKGLNFLKDSLTKLVNKKTPFTLLFIDIDDFKKTNDQYGHNIGNEILIELVDILKKNLRPNYYFARFGGEEFAIILPEVKKEQGINIAQRLKKVVEEHSFLQEKSAVIIPIKVTISIGVTEFNGQKCNIEKLIEEADQLMYQAKKKGKNCVCFK